MNVRIKVKSGKTYTIKTNKNNKDLLVLNGGVFDNMDIKPLLRELKVGDTVPIEYADTENSRKNTVFQQGKCVLTSIESIEELGE